MSKRIEYLYRIIKWEHLIDLFETRKLYFSNPREWEDPYESRVDHPSMADVFAQCCGRQGVSDAMWRIYSPNQYGVRVKVRRRTLVAQLDDAKRQKEFKFRRIGPVKYRKQSEIDSKLKELVHQLSNNYVPKDAFDITVLEMDSGAFELGWRTKGKNNTTITTQHLIATTQTTLVDEMLSAGIPHERVEGSVSI